MKTRRSHPARSVRPTAAARAPRAATPLASESRRLEALQRYEILDTPPEREFDELTALAAEICQTPISLVSLLDASRQWFKSRVGLGITETPRTIAFCDHAIRGSDLMIVADAQLDERFAENPLVRGAPGIRFYAGAPLVTADGATLGTLCVIDHVPRELTPSQLHALRVLSRQVMAGIELRHRIRAHQATERSLRELAARLETQNARLVEAQAVAKVGSWETDLATLNVTWSDETHRIFETDPAAFQPTHARFLERVHPDDRVAVDQAFVASAAQTGPCAFEHRVLLPDGRIKTVEEHWQVFRDEQGRPVRATGTCRDITERKKLEERVLRSQRLESLGTLAGGIAHDLNNLLAPIVMGVDLLKLLVTDPAPMRTVNNIERSARRGKELVRQVLSFARGVEGARVSIAARHLVREIEDIVQTTFPKNIAFESDVPRDLWLTAGDPTQLNQVLLNLCVNARDAMPRGGRLRLTARNVVIDRQFATMTRHLTAGRYVRLDILDTGTGIAPEVMDRIFEPFFTTKELGQGTGLGLSTAIGIVRSHGGVIDVASTVGRGSTFSVYLPAQSDEAAPEDPAPPETLALPRGRGQLVLVVDDEATVRDVTRQTLENFGYRVLTAEDGAQAVAVYATHRSEIAAVLTDMMMPVMDGSALIAALRRIDPRLPIVAASGLDTEESHARAATGTSHFLAKPYSAEALLESLGQVLAA